MEWISPSNSKCDGTLIQIYGLEQQRVIWWHLLFFGGVDYPFKCPNALWGQCCNTISSVVLHRCVSRLSHLPRHSRLLYWTHLLILPSADTEMSISPVSSPPRPLSWSIHLSCHTGQVCMLAQSLWRDDTRVNSMQYQNMLVCTQNRVWSDLCNIYTIMNLIKNTFLICVLSL